MNTRYDAAAIEVLTGLDPVRKRPGMYTDTSRPNHLAQEVIDNSVDEALAGFATQIDVVLYRDGSLSVSDDGRGMPVDIHPEEGRPGVEVILCTLHAGGKFSNKSYHFSGGLHGVGVSVVNALSKRLEITVKRDGGEWRMVFAGGEKVSELEQIGTVGRKIPAPDCTSGLMPITSNRPNFPCRDLSTCCAPRRCCARSCGCASTTRRPTRKPSGTTKTA